jgi:hypothetical protein
MKLQFLLAGIVATGLFASAPDTVAHGGFGGGGGHGGGGFHGGGGGLHGGHGDFRGRRFGDLHGRGSDNVVSTMTAPARANATGCPAARAVERHDRRSRIDFELRQKSPTLPAGVLIVRAIRFQC